MLVCILAGETSPIREWVTAFFRSTMPALVGAGGLTVCGPPYDAQRAKVVPLEPPNS